MKEIWRNIDGYDGRYAVSTWGRVRGISGILKPYTTSKGYLKVGLMKNGKSEKHRIHRLVANAFLPNPHKLPEVNHIDGNKKNNSISNLEWVSGKENIAHSKILMAMIDMQTKKNDE